MTNDASPPDGPFQEFCPYCGIPTCPECGGEMERPPGRPRKLLTPHERDMVRQLGDAGYGVRTMANAINQARREQWGPAALQVTYWTTQREVERLRREEARD